MRRIALSILLAASLVGCTSKASLTVEIEVRRSDLTELELVLQKPDGAEVTRCRIYADADTPSSDRCPFENADSQKQWNGEERIQERLNFLVYGDLDVTSVKATVAGFKDGRQMVAASGSADFLSESPQTLLLELPGISEVAKSCAKPFDFVSGTSQGTNSFGLSIMKTDEGHDLVYARGPNVHRYRYVKTSSSSENCVSEIKKIDIGKCSMRPQHMVVGPFLDGESELVGLICEAALSGGMNGVPLPTRLKLVDFAANEPRQKLFQGSLRSEQLSPLTLVSRLPRSANSDRTYELFVAAVQTATHAPPQISMLRALPNRNVLMEHSRLTQVNPVMNCGPNNVPCREVDIAALPACQADEILISEAGCVRCRRAQDFNPMNRCTDDEIYYKELGLTQELTCIPRSECLYEQYLGLLPGSNRFSAPYAPVGFIRTENMQKPQSGMLLAGYPGGFAFFNSDGEWVEQLTRNREPSLFQPVSLSTDGHPALLAFDYGVDKQFNLSFASVELSMDPEVVSTQVSVPMPSNTLRGALEVRSYAIGSDDDKASNFAIFGGFSLDSTDGGDAVTTLSLRKINLGTTQSGKREVSYESMSTTFSVDSLTTGIRGTASIRIADFDGDPRDTEILVYQPEYGSQLHGYKIIAGELVPLRGFPIPLEGREALPEERPLVVILADLDSDGQLEIIAGDVTMLRVYSLGVDSYNSEKLYWPMERLDPQNSGAYDSNSAP